SQTRNDKPTQAKIVVSRCVFHSPHPERANEAAEHGDGIHGSDSRSSSTAGKKLSGYCQCGRLKGHEGNETCSERDHYKPPWTSIARNEVACSHHAAWHDTVQRAIAGAIGVRTAK